MYIKLRYQLLNLCASQPTAWGLGYLARFQESRQFLLMLEDKGLSILNGRYAGDRQGDFTCRNHKGASVVDLAMADQRLLPEIVECEVLPWETPELVPGSRPMSDHRPIRVEILLNQNLAESEPEPPQQEDQTQEDEDIDESQTIPKFEYASMPMDTFIKAAMESEASKLIFNMADKISQPGAVQPGYIAEQLQEAAEAMVKEAGGLVKEQKSATKDSRRRRAKMQEHE